MKTVTHPISGARAALFGLAIALGGCGNESTPVLPADPEAADYPGIEEIAQPVTALSTTCTWAATNSGTVTVTVADKEVAIISKSSSSTNILVNGQTCVGGSTTATTANTKVISVVEKIAGKDQTVIIDYSYGQFGTATKAGEGFQIDLGTATAMDAVKIRGSSSADTFTFGKTSGSVYAVQVNGDANPDILVNSGVGSQVTVVVSGGKGADTISGQGGTALGLPSAWDKPLVIYGGDGDDKPTGGSGNDTLYGGAGNDTIKGMAGNDTLNGEDGDDLFDEGAAANGDDAINGGAGTDTVDYSARTVALVIALDGTTNSGDQAATEHDILGTDVENAKGGSAADTMTGNASANTLWGNDGDDPLTGGAGNDTLWGGNGNDTFLDGNATNGMDVFNGGAGTDTVDYSSRTNALTITIEGTANDGESNEKDNVMTDVENVIGGSGGDTITGSSSDNRLEGRDGNDVLHGGVGNDVLVGGTGTDKLYGDAGDDTLLEEADSNGADEFWGSDGVDTVDYTLRTHPVTVTMAGDNKTSGSTTNNDGESGEQDNVMADVENLLCPSGAYVCTVTGNDLDNEIVGGAGDDVLSGGKGNDTIDGAGGSNTIEGDSGSGGANEGDGDICFCSPTATACTLTHCEL